MQNTCTQRSNDVHSIYTWPVTLYLPSWHCISRCDTLSVDVFDPTLCAFKHVCLHGYAKYTAYKYFIYTVLNADLIANIKTSLSLSLYTTNVLVSALAMRMVAAASPVILPRNHLHT